MYKTKFKVIALMLCVCLCFGIATPVAASSTASDVENTTTEEIDWSQYPNVNIIDDDEHDHEHDDDSTEDESVVEVAEDTVEATEAPVEGTPVAEAATTEAPIPTAKATPEATAAPIEKQDNAGSVENTPAESSSAVQRKVAPGGLFSSISNAVHLMSSGSHEDHDNLIWESWWDSSSLPYYSGNFYLTSDVELWQTWEVPGDVNLCLNGYKITMTTYNGGGAAIYVNNGYTLNIYDCEDTGIITGGTDGMNYMTMMMSSGGIELYNGTVNLYGGNITGNNRGINMENGWNTYLNIHGGSISNNDGYGIYAYNGEITMDGGTISGNADIGVYVGSSSSFAMSGGEISGNHGYSGAGVYDGSYSGVTLSGGTITENTATDNGCGAGFYSEGNSSVNISGDIKIYNNIAGSANKDVTLNSGTLTVSSALTSGAQIGIYADSACTFTSGFSTYNGGDDASAYFFSNNDSLAVFTSGGEATLDAGYTIKYDANGASTGTVPAAPASMTSGSTYTVLGNTGNLTAGSLSFLRWNTAPDGSGTDYNAGDTFTVTSSVTLYAQWPPHIHNEITYTGWSSKISLPTTAGNYYLMVDVKLSSEYSAPSGTMNLCLNGHKITQSTSDLRVMNVGNSRTLNLYDCIGSGKITGGTYNGNGIGIYINGGTFTMESGEISGNNSPNQWNGYGGGVYLNNGTFNMNGGSIKNNSSYYGGGLQVAGGTFNMTGGSIENNTCYQCGAGVYYTGGTFNLSGGSIVNNTAGYYGGGIYVGSNDFNISGSPVVQNNKYGSSTNNIYLQSTSYYIKITGVLTSGAYLGIYTTTSRVVTQNYGYLAGSNAGTAAGTYIYSDNTSYTPAIHLDDVALSSSTTCTVTFYDGSTSTGTQSFTRGTAAALNAAPAKSGWTFAGWATTNNTSTTTFSDGATIYVALNASLYAVYSRDITFYYGENKADSATVTQYWYGGSSKAITAPVLSDTGNWTAYGWYTGTDAVRQCNVVGNASFIPDATTYYAVYSRVVGVLTYNANTGTGTREATSAYQYYNSYNVISDAMAVVEGNTFTAPDGKVFEAWNTSDVGTGTAYNESDSYIVSVAYTFGTSAFSASDVLGTLYAKWIELDPHIHDEGTVNEMSFQPWTGRTSLPDTAGNWALLHDITLSEQWAVPTGTVNLCLDGHTITQSGTARVIYIAAGCALTLYNCQDTGIVTGGSADNGGGVFVDGGTFIMNGGTISGNASTGTGTYNGGGGVYIVTGAFTMNGGAITNNTASKLGGGILAYNSTYSNTSVYTVNINNGTIASNSATNGGGIYASSSYTGKTFAITGGTIRQNTASSYGGGVYFNNSYTGFSVSGGTIKDNSAGYGGGMYTTGSISITSGSFLHNSATNTGGGIQSNGTLTLSGSTISGNSATNGGGVYGYYYNTLTLSNVTITNNKATSNGGGVYCGNSRVSGSIQIQNNMKGGTITDNGNGTYTVSGGTTNNLQLYGAAYNMTVNGLLTGSTIGVYNSTARTITANYGFNGGTHNEIQPNNYFTSDNASYGVYVDGNGNAKLGTGCTISYDGTSGSGSAPATSTNVAIDTVYTVLDNTYTSSSAFLGWNTKSDGTGTNYDAGDEVTVVQDITFYAQWAPHIHNNVTFEPWTGTSELPSSSGCYYLTSDIILYGTWDVPSYETVSLCLNGHSVNTYGEGSIIRVGNGSTYTTATLNMYDCTDNGSIAGGNGGFDWSTNTAWGGGVYIWGDGSVFNLYGGNIAGNSFYDNSGMGITGGGGVTVDSYAIFNMYGGSISNNMSSDHGGGVYLKEYGYGTFNMYGGTITGNSAGNYGGGVYIDYDSTFAMTGGSITGNSASVGGGGVYINYGTFNVSGSPVVTTNTVSSSANNVQLPDTYRYITVTGALSSGANLGIYASSEQVFTSGYGYNGGYNDNVAPNTYFSSDNTAYAISEDNGEGKVGEPLYEHSHNGVNFTKLWTTANALPSVEGNYCLGTDVTLTSEWSIPSGTTRICLNGHSITQTGTYRVLNASTGRVLEIYDCSDNETGTITGGNLQISYAIHAYGGGIYVNGGTVSLYGGRISGNSVTTTYSYNDYSSYGGGVYVGSGTFNMYGGYIEHNYVKRTVTSLTCYGGGVAIGGGTFNFTGGTITNNKAGESASYYGYGGGIYVGGGTFNVGGNPIVTGNTTHATSGGNNVYLASDKIIQIISAIGDDASVGIYVSRGKTLTSGYGYYSGLNSGKTPSDWLVDDNTTYNFDFLVTNAGEIVYSKQYTITYMATGATSGSAPASTTVYYGETYTVLGNTGEMTCDGLQLKNSLWGTNLEGTGTNYGAGYSIRVEKNITLYPQWEFTTAHKHGDDNTFSPWVSATSMPSVAGKYALVTDVTLNNGYWSPATNTEICLNGHTVTADTSILIDSSRTVSLNDCQGSGYITGGSGIEAAIHVLSGGTFKMYGGAIKNTAIGAVKVSGGTFELYSGEISGSSIYGVTVDNGGTFNMYGILSEYLDGYGVFSTGSTTSMEYITTNGGGRTFPITASCKISDNGSDGVIVNDTSTFIMRGGEISGNHGYGIRNESSQATTLVMYGAQICDNRLSGILNSRGNLGLFGCTIENNSGRGVWNYFGNLIIGDARLGVGSRSETEFFETAIINNTTENLNDSNGGGIQTSGKLGFLSAYNSVSDMAQDFPFTTALNNRNYWSGSVSIMGNIAGNGGGIYVVSAEQTIGLSELNVAYNSADVGGGIYVADGSTIQCKDSVDVRYNNGGGIYVSTGNLEFTNTYHTYVTNNVAGGTITYNQDTNEYSIEGGTPKNIDLGWSYNIILPEELSSESTSAWLGITFERDVDSRLMNKHGVFTNARNSSWDISRVVSSDQGYNLELTEDNEAKIAYQTVTYAANGGNTNSLPGHITGESIIFDSNVWPAPQGGTHTVRGSSPTRQGYSFTGWNTVADGTGVDYEAGATLSVNDEDITLYAQWEAESHEHNSKSFEPWESTNSLPSTSGNYYLTANVNLSDTWNVPNGNVSLCLNGYTIRRSSSSGFSVVTVKNGSTLNLYDCEGTGKIANGTGRLTSTSGSGGTVFYRQAGGVDVRSGGELNMYGGTITGNSLSSYNTLGAGIYCDGTLNMYGGSVTDNTATPGSNCEALGTGIYISGNATFTISGDVNISGNTASGTANNLWIHKNQVITVTGPLASTARIGINATNEQTLTRNYGYNAGGYNEGVAPTTNFTLDNNNYVMQLTSAGEITTAKLYTVTYSGNGNTTGSVPAPPETIVSGTTYTVLGNTGSLSSNGIEFTSWNTSADGTGTRYVAGSTFTVSEDVTLYAQYKSDYDITTSTTGVGTVTYTVGGDTVTAAAEGDTVTITAAPSSASGYGAFTLSAETDGGQTVTITNTSTGGTFTMPADNVTVTVTFTKVFQVTVPTVLPVTVATNGNVTVSHAVTVDNNGSDRVSVSDVDVEEMNSWNLVDYDTDFEAVSVGLKHFALKVMDKDAYDELNNVADEFEDIDAGSSVDIDYDVKAATQNAAVEATVAKIIFTVEWAS